MLLSYSAPLFALESAIQFDSFFGGEQPFTGMAYENFIHGNFTTCHAIGLKKTDRATTTTIICPSLKDVFSGHVCNILP